MLIRLTTLFAFVALVHAQSQTTGTHARFDLTTPRGAPFPSNIFNVGDPAHIIGLRVNLLLPDCAARPSDCADLQVVNDLDGFNVQPRLSIPFDNPVDPGSLSSSTIFLIRLGKPDVQTVGINQIIWDPLTNTVYAESDELLEQHTRYALIVTSGVRDRSGQPVLASDGFRNFRQLVDDSYRASLGEAIQAGVPEARLSQCTGPRSTARRPVAAWFYTSTAWPEVFSKTSAQGRSPHDLLTARPLKSCATVGLALGPDLSGGVRQRTNSFWRFLNNVLTAAASAGRLRDLGLIEKEVEYEI